VTDRSTRGQSALASGTLRRGGGRAKATTMNETISIATGAHEDWIDITRQVRAAVKQSGLEEGVVTVFVPHTTAAVTIQENADPPLKGDIDEALRRLFPWQGRYGHGEDNAAAHMKAMVTGQSEQIPFVGGRLQLGTWQGIYFCEFDGPRSRKVVIQISG
jgi:secondary thiamine-phosphate synthase enzyme